MIAIRVNEERRTIVRDMGLLQSALFRPETVAFGVEAYTDVFDKAAALLQSLACNHPFFDGNKRTAWISCMLMLRLNGVRLRVDVDLAEKLVLDVATGRLENVSEIGDALRGLQ
ncbi:type II toxin-antitoxin system death-on-curing family toxin [Nocardia sp. NPDC127579]|uniref:type II toxin-antitoxin system death-on-curing family toxin n=1 Tax=Nocardia sp. NPDC127579 TaxID=3345402 RepID=UPI0036408E29